MTNRRTEAEVRAAGAAVAAALPPLTQDQADLVAALLALYRAAQPEE